MGQPLVKEGCGDTQNRSVIGPELFFTKNNQALAEYYRVREICYRSVTGGPKNFDGSEDELDKISDVLVVKMGGEIIGGARLVGSTPENRILLPTEQPGFTMDEVFPKLMLKNKRYCEFGRIALMEDYRGINLLEKICSALIIKAIRLNYEYQFSMAPLVTSRVYRKVSQNLKLPHAYIIHNIKIPQKSAEITGGLKMYLGSLKLPSSTASLAFNYISDSVRAFKAT